MTKTVAEIRFDNARKRLGSALKGLEEMVKDRLHEAAEIQSKILSPEEVTSVKKQMRMVEQSVTIQNLTNEMSNLENSLSEVSDEAEFLRNQHKDLMKKLDNLYEEKESLVSAIEADLSRIDDIIKDGEIRC